MSLSPKESYLLLSTRKFWRQRHCNSHHGSNVSNLPPTFHPTHIIYSSQMSCNIFSSSNVLFSSSVRRRVYKWFVVSVHFYPCLRIGIRKSGSWREACSLKFFKHRCVFRMTTMTEIDKVTRGVLSTGRNMERLR